MNRIYKINIPYVLMENRSRKDLINYGSELVKESIKRDFGVFAFDDYKILFKNIQCKREDSSLDHKWYYNFEITENLETNQMIIELEERLKIGL